MPYLSIRQSSVSSVVRLCDDFFETYRSIPEQTSIQLLLLRGSIEW